MAPPEVDSKKVDAVVKNVRTNYDSDAWPWDDDFGYNFHGNESRESMDKLLTLNSEEFKAAWDKMDTDPFWANHNLKTTLAHAATGHGLTDPKYQDLIKALEDNNRDIYYNALRKKETDAEKPEFGTGTKPNPLLGEDNKHAHEVKLRPPEGTRPGDVLDLMVSDTSSIMTLAFDTLGYKQPKEDPPTFSKDLIDNPRITTVEGLSEIKDKHDELKANLQKRLDAESEKHKIAVDATLDTWIMGQKLFTELEKMTEEAQSILDVKMTGWIRDGDKLTKSSNTTEQSSKVSETIFERDTKDNKFYLSDSVEATYYIEPLRQLVIRWRAKYKEAADTFLKDAKKLPGSGDGAGDGSAGKGAGAGDGSAGKGAGGRSGGAGDGSAGAGDGSAGKAGGGAQSGQGTDFSGLFNSELGNGVGGQQANPNANPAAPGTTATPVSDTTSTDTTGDDASAAAFDDARERIVQSATAAPAVYNPGMNNGGGAGGNSGGAVNSNAGAGMEQALVMSSILGAQNRNQDTSGNQNDGHESRRRHQPGTVTPAGNTTPGAPGAPAPGTTNQPDQPAVTADHTTPPPPSDPRLKTVNIPGLDKPQQVTPLVYDALTKEMNNPEGCDARAAYDGTQGLSAPTQVTETNLHTGDVVQWANGRSALVVMTEHGPQILINGHLGPVDENGQLVRFDPNNLPPGLPGEFKDFQGYFRPNGAELPADGQASAESKPVDPPKVAAPATPGVIPTGTPPTGPREI